MYKEKIDVTRKREMENKKGTHGWVEHIDELNTQAGFHATTRIMRPCIHTRITKERREGGGACCCVVAHTWSNHVLTRFCQSLWKCWLGMTLLCRTILPCGRVKGNEGGIGQGDDEEEDDVSVLCLSAEA